MAIHPKIKEQIEKIASINIEEDIVKSKELGSMSFTGIVNQLNYVIRLLNNLLFAGTEFLTDNWVGDLHDKLREMNNVLISIKAFRNDSRNPSQERTGLMQTFDRAYQELLPHLLRALEISKYDESASTEQGAMLKSIRAIHSEVENMAVEFKKTVDKNIETLNQSMQVFGMRKYATIFEKESKSFGESAKWWLGYTITLLVITIGIGTLLLLYSKELTSNFDAVQYTVTKVLIITALFYGVSICIKTYRAQKHNEILNKHRQNALMTFEAFKTEDVQTKNAILLEATHTIFGNQSTGYNSNDSSDGDLPSRVIEFIKTPSNAKS